MPICPECHEELMSQVTRGPYYFHRHVVYGPYHNPEPHPCSLVNDPLQAMQITLASGDQLGPRIVINSMGQKVIVTLHNALQD